MLRSIPDPQELLGPPLDQAPILVLPHPLLQVSHLPVFLHCCCGQAKADPGQAGSLRLHLRFPLPPPLLAVKVVEDLLVSRLPQSKVCLRHQLLLLHSRFLVSVSSHSQ